MALASNTGYGLAASIWTQNVSLALDTAAKVKAGVMWINSTNMFDAAADFGNCRESGFGREGLHEYLVPNWLKALPEAAAPSGAKLSALPAEATKDGLPIIDRTAKLYVGSKQVRPDSGYSFTVRDAKGAPLGQAGLGNRKDIRNAVEAAAKAGAWGAATAHNRSQVLFYVAAAREVAAAVERTFFYAA